jgi:hypothetical protein
MTLIKLNGMGDNTMPATVIDCPKVFGMLGGFSRAYRSGPESDLVNWFIEQMPLAIPRGCRATVFREPKLTSGFPDLVVVTWRERITKQWQNDRLKITDAELRLLNHVVRSGRCTNEDLELHFEGNISRRTERLVSAGLLRNVSGGWKARSLSASYAVEDIIAIEAKINDWSSVLSQAYVNKWFASQSYVLVPNMPRSEKVIAEAASLGIGIWTKQKGCCLEPTSNMSQLPISYASWQFNEWIWRAEKHRTATNI